MKKIVLVTGGSSGLGWEIAQKHLALGNNVCIVGRNQERLQQAQEKLLIAAPSGTLLALPCNVADESEVKKLYQRLEYEQYELSLAYHAAGIGLYGHHENVNRPMIDALLEANLIGLILISTYSVKAMKEKGGTIVNILSSAAKKANPLEAVYCAAKWGARGYTESLQAALKGSNIKILAVYPGGMNTPFWQHDTGLSPDTSKFITPAEAAEVIVEAASKRGSLFVSELSLERV